MGQRGEPELDPSLGAPDPVATWSEGLAHQLRNQQMVLSNSLFSLRAVAEGDDQSRNACLRLAESGIHRSIEILEAFTCLAYPARDALTPYLSELLGWWGTLVTPRVKRREATLVIDLPEVTPRVAGAEGVRVLTALADRVVPLLTAEAELRLELAEGGESAPELAISVLRTDSSPLEEISESLGEHVPGARLVPGRGGPRLVLPLAPFTGDPASPAGGAP